MGYGSKIKDVLRAERDAIDALIKSDYDLEPAVAMLAACRGRIVWMGVGKSGHIGAKLAATFASLGVPSIFVHATEAMHGDLGMIGADDIAVLISNSGSTQEVVQCVTPLARLGVTTVAFTSVRDSALARACDGLILQPHLGEADTNGLAPTVSSTLTLALGDAIACALSAERGWTREQFYRYHPNGALGKLLSGEQQK